MIPLFDGRTELTANMLNEIIGQAMGGKVMADPPLEIHCGPDGQVTITVNRWSMMEYLAPSANTIDELEAIFSPRQAIAAQAETPFEWLPAKVVDFDGVRYYLNQAGFVDDTGEFYDLDPASADTYQAVEFSGNLAVPIGKYVWTFAAGQGLESLYLFFCPELTQVVRFTSSTPNNFGLYPGMLQGYSHPPRPQAGDLPIEEPPSGDQPEDEPGQWSFADISAIWITVPPGVEPTVGSWVLAREVGVFDDGLPIYATSAGGDSATSCECGGDVLIPPMGMNGSTLSIDQAGLGITGFCDCSGEVVTLPRIVTAATAGSGSGSGGSDTAVMYVRRSNDIGTRQLLQLCPTLPNDEVVFYGPPASIVNGYLYVSKYILTLIEGMLTATFAGIDSVALACGETTNEDPQFVFTQETETVLWIIVHNLGRFPKVTTTDLDKNEINGTVAYAGVNLVTVSWGSPQAGFAYLT